MQVVLIPFETNEASLGIALKLQFFFSCSPWFCIKEISSQQTLLQIWRVVHKWRHSIIYLYVALLLTRMTNLVVGVLKKSQNCVTSYVDDLLRSSNHWNVDFYPISSPLKGKFDYRLMQKMTSSVPKKLWLTLEGVLREVSWIYFFLPTEQVLQNLYKLQITFYTKVGLLKLLSVRDWQNYPKK